MPRFLKTMLAWCLSVWETADQVARGKAVDTIERELEELEHIFGLLVLGSFVGLPSPPMQISLDLMPHMEKELILMLKKVDTASEPLSQLFSVFDIG
ncbi:hypothetical protein KKI24_20420 [bacterium]|nr:hypothetical protein [bacterium]